MLPENERHFAEPLQKSTLEYLAWILCHILACSGSEISLVNLRALVLDDYVFELVDNNYFQKENVAIGSKVDKIFVCRYIRSDSSNSKESRPPFYKWFFYNRLSSVLELELKYAVFTNGRPGDIYVGL